MSHILKIKNRYYYNRRVPKEIKDFDSREYVRISLKTDSYSEALKLCSLYDKEVTEFWHSLIRTQSTYDPVRFDKIIKLARQIGFIYKSLSEVKVAPTEELIERVLATKPAVKSRDVVEAVVGADHELFISQALEEYFRLTKNLVMNKSRNQLRKWENPRKRVFNRFLEIVGDGSLSGLNRDKMITFRDHYIE